VHDLLESYCLVLLWFWWLLSVGVSEVKRQVVWYRDRCWFPFTLRLKILWPKQDCKRPCLNTYHTVHKS
jgi:hypothetical protein